MKKSLLALAVMGAFAGGVAHAADSVQLYGVLDMGVERVDNGTNSQVGLGDGLLATSRIGVKGGEDLGGGMKAIFQAEFGFAGGASQNSGLTGRDTYVGLTGGFGTVLAGRISSLTDGTVAAYDAFGNSNLGGIAVLGNWGVSDKLIGNSSNNWNAYDPLSRNNTTLAYVSPNFGGFTAGAAYVFANGTYGTNSNNKTGAAYNLMAKYANGPLSVGGAYMDANTPDGQDAFKHFILGGSYDLGVVKLFGEYLQNKMYLANIGVANLGFSPTPSTGFLNGATANANGTKYTAWSLGASAPIGPGSLMVSYGQGKWNDISASKAQQFSLGYNYALSKRTSLYAIYQGIKNDDNAGAQVNKQGVTPSGAAYGKNQSAIGLGITHKF